MAKRDLLGHRIACEAVGISPDIVAALKSQTPGTQVLAALRAFLRKDLYLLEVNVNERSITHRFATFLQEQFPTYHVDCEYNRDGIDPKKLSDLNLHPDAEDADARTVFPDIIVHSRGESGKNYLVLECKKDCSSVSPKVDLQKLGAYRQELGFEFALFVKFGTLEAAGVEEVIWDDV